MKKSFLYAGIEFTPAYDLQTEKNRMAFLRVASNAENLLAKKDYDHTEFYKAAKQVTNGGETDLFACKYGYFLPAEHPFFIFLDSLGQTSEVSLNEILEKSQRFEHDTPPFFYNKEIEKIEVAKPKIFNFETRFEIEYYSLEYRIFDHKKEKFVGAYFSCLADAQFFLKKLKPFLFEYGDGE